MIAETGLVALNVHADGSTVPDARIVIGPEGTPKITGITDPEGILTLTVPVGIHPIPLTRKGNSQS